MKLLIILSVLFTYLTFSTKNNDDILVIGGEPAEITDVPWQAALYNGLGSDAFRCGGVVIGENLILTAAHCVLENLGEIQTPLNPKTLFIRVGIDDRADSQAKYYKVEAYIVHNDYRKDGTYFGDIAIIKLEEKLDLNNPNIQAIELLTPEQEIAGLNAPGVMALTSGWGANDPVTNESSDQLMKVEIPIVDLDTAKAWFTRYQGEEFTALLDDDQIPAGFEEGGKSSCFGDSGGPLVVKNEDETEYLLTGIVSWGPECAGVKTPGVYSRVPYHYDWIRNLESKLLPELKNEVSINEVALNIPVLIKDCESDGYSLYFTVVNDGNASISTIDYDLIVETKSDVLRLPKQYEFETALEPGKAINFVDYFDLEEIEGDAIFSFQIAAANSISINSEPSGSASSSVIKNDLIVEYQLDFQEAAPTVSIYNQYLESSESIELDRSGETIISNLCGNIFQNEVYLNHSNDLSGWLKISAVDSETGELVTLYYWDDSMNLSEDGEETFFVSIPFVKSTDLLLTNFSLFDECESVDSDDLFNLRVFNRSNYFLEDISIELDIEGELSSHNFSGLNMFTNEFVSENITLNEQNTEVRASVYLNETLENEYYYLFKNGQGKTRFLTYQNMPSGFVFANLELNSLTDDESIMVDLDEAGFEACMPDKCYEADFIIYHFNQGEPPSFTNQNLVFTDSDGNIVKTVNLEEQGAMYNRPMTFDVCFDDVETSIMIGSHDDLTITPEGIKLNKGIIKDVKVYNFSGQQVLINHTSNFVDTSKINNGIYLFRIETLDGVIYSDKILKY